MCATGFDFILPADGTAHFNHIVVVANEESAAFVGTDRTTGVIEIKRRVFQRGSGCDRLEHFHGREIERQQAGTSVDHGWLVERRIPQVNRFPFVTARGLFGQGFGAVGGPKRIISDKFGGGWVAIDIAHCAAGTAFNRFQEAVLVNPKIHIIQKQRVMAEFVRQNNRPIVADALAGCAVAIPGCAHMHLAGRIHDVGVLRIERVGKHNAALRRVGAQAIARMHDDIGIRPFFGALRHAHLTKRHLAIAEIIQILRSAAQIETQLIEIRGCGGRIPFQRHPQIKQNQRMRRRNINRLHTRFADYKCIQANGRWSAVGVIQRVGGGLRDGNQRQQTISNINLAASTEKTALVGAEWCAATGQRLAADHGFGGQTVNQRIWRGNAVVCDFDLGCSHPKRRGLGALIRALGHCWHGIRLWFQRRIRQHPKDDVIRRAEKATFEGVPIKNICAWHGFMPQAVHQQPVIGVGRGIVGDVAAHLIQAPMPSQTKIIGNRQRVHAGLNLGGTTSHIPQPHIANRALKRAQRRNRTTANRPRCNDGNRTNRRNGGSDFYAIAIQAPSCAIIRPREMHPPI